MSVHDLDRDLDHLQPQTGRKFRKFINDVEAEFGRAKTGYTFLFLSETLRSYERQDYLFFEGSGVTKARAGQSDHNFGLAGDLYPCLKGRPVFDFMALVPDPRDPKKRVYKYPDLVAKWRRVMDLAELNGLRPGGRWKGSFKDFPHFSDAERPPLYVCRKKWPGGYQPVKAVS